MNIGTNIGVDTSSSAFISAASNKDPLSYDYWIDEAGCGMFHSTTILESAVYITCFYLSFSLLDRNYFGQPEFMRKWKISPATAMDVACKVISAGFAMSATLCGIFILLISPSYTPSINQDRSSFLVDRVMVWATSYFIYDFFAMFHVYLARKQEKSDSNSFCSDPTLSQTLNSNNTDYIDVHAKNSCTDNNELINSKLITNDDATSTLSNISNSKCDTQHKSINDDINSVTMKTISNTKPSLWTYIEDNPLMAAHHLIIGVFLIPMMSVHYPRHEPGDMMIAAALIFEASTPFVSLRSVLSQLDGMRSSRLYMINGIAMVVAFFCCRILIYPIFYKIYGIQRNISMFQGIMRTPWQCSVYMIGLLLPQLYWFRIMFIGALKVIREEKKET